jgi:Carboxypeptidase regulatory-like domain/TonB dependent receptor-like, beta-barrel
MKRVLMWSMLVAILPAGLAAQEFTGSVVGTVSDSSGGVLPGATVTISGVTLQGDRVTVSDERGVYRVINLPPGTYSVSYTVEGFAKLTREGIIVGVGRAVTLNIELQLATLSDAVTVSGESPVVDIQNANLGVNFDQQLLENTPIGARNIGSVITAIPGIQVTAFDVGGSNMGTNTGFRSYGLSGQFNVRLDGVSTQELAGNLNLYIDYAALSEMQVSAAGNSAESNVPGAAINMTVRTGGNRFSGSFYTDYEGESFQGENLTEELKDRGIGVGDKFDSYNEVNVQAGGPIKVDKLWWYYSFRNQKIGQTTEMLKEDGTPGALFELLLRNNTLKVNYQINPNNSVFFTGQTGRKRANRGGRGPTAVYYNLDSTGLQNSIVWLNKGQWNRIIGNRMTLEAAANGESYDAPYFANVEETPYRDLVTNIVRGSYTGDSPGLTTGGVFRDASRKWQWYGAASFFTSSHNLKTSYGVIWVDRKSVMWGNPGSPGSTGHVVLYYSNGVPDRFQTQNTPRDYQSSMWQNYFFVQDRWQATDRLVLNLGLRWDNYDSHYPAQGNSGVGPYAIATSFPARTVAIFNNWVPRIGAIYDLFGNTKTALKFNYGRYAEDPDIALSNSANPNTAVITNRYAWDGTLPITPALVARSQLLQTTGQLTEVRIDPNLTNSITDQWLAGIEHELLRNLAIGGTFVRALRYKTRGNINLAEPSSGYAPVEAIDPGPDGLVRTADDRPFTVFERLGPAGSDQLLTNFDTGEYYDTWEVNATKRFANGGRLVTGWDRTWRHLGDAISNDPNQQLYDGPNRATTSQWTYKLIGSYPLPWWDLGLSGSYMGQKGEPYSRTVQFTPALLVNHPAPLRQGNTTVTVEPPSAFYREDVHMTNIRVDKLFRLAGTQRIMGIVELFNVFNSAAVTGTNNVTGRTTDRHGANVPSFGRATQIINPRVVRLAVRYDF